MKLGLSTWSLLRMDVCAAVRAIGDSGLEYIELWGEVPHAYPDWTDKRRLRDALSAYDMTVTVHAPFTDLNPASPFQPVKGAIDKTLEGFVEFSVDLGAAMVTVHPGSVHNELMVAGAAPSSIATMGRLIRAAGGRLSINIENLSKGTPPYHYPLGSTAESLAELLAGAEGARCTLDTGHARLSGLDPLEMLSRLGGTIAEVHLSDNSGTTDEHRLPGEGSTPLKEFCTKISRTDALVCLELNPHVYGPDAVLEGARAARRMFA